MFYSLLLSRDIISRVFKKARAFLKNIIIKLYFNKYLYNY